MANTLSLIYKSDKTRKFFWLFLSRIMPLVSLFFITIIYSRNLTYDDYGKFQSIWIYVNIMNVILSFGLIPVILSTDLGFLFAFIKNKGKTLGLFYSILWISGLIAFFFLAKNFNTSLKFLLIVFIVIQNIAIAADNFLIKFGKERISGYINFFYAFLFFGWHIYILFVGYSIYYLIAGITIISAIRFIIIALIHIKNSLHKNFIDIKSDGNHFLYHWVYLGLNDTLGVFAKWVDKIFLLYLLTNADFAIFFNGSLEVPFFGLLISVAGSFLSIEVSDNIGNTDKIIRLFRESFNILSTVVFPLFFLMFFFREELFSLAFSGKYNASLPIFVISIFILPMQINNYSVILQCFSQGKIVLFGSLIDISIAIILMLALYPIMDTRGIALAIVISTYCQAAYYLWHSAKILHTSILHILPLNKLIIRFLIFFTLYFILFFTLSAIGPKIKLSIVAIFTAVIVGIGIMNTLKLFSKKMF